MSVGKALAVAGVAFTLMSGGVLLWMSGGEDAQVEVAEASQSEGSFEPYMASQSAARVEQAPEPRTRPVARAPKKESVITESERPPEDLSEWDTERKAPRSDAELTVDDLPPDIRKVVLDDLPPRGVYEPRLSLDKLRKARRANATQRKMLSKLAWEGALPTEKIDLLKARNKRANKAVDTTEGER